MIKEGVHIKGIYQHYKGGYYKVEDVAFHHETGESIVIYSKCNQHGIYLSIRDKNGLPSVHQPFYRDLNEFKEMVGNINRFNFIRHS